jgi:ATP-binding protein involved in chromosome partitioning
LFCQGIHYSHPGKGAPEAYGPPIAGPLARDIGGNFGDCEAPMTADDRPDAMRDRLAQALDSVPDPAGGGSILKTGRASGITFGADGTAGVILGVEGLRKPAADLLEKAVGTVMARVPGVTRTRVIQTSERHMGASTDHVEGVRHVLAVASGKGGVGKSTVAANLALALQRRGLKVGLLDADIHGPSAHIILGIAERARATLEKRLTPVEAHGLKVLGMGLMADPDRAVAWRGPMISGAMVQMAQSGDWGGIDVLVVDMPPGTGDIQLTLAQKLAPSGVVLVTTPQMLAVADARRAAALFAQLSVPVLGVIANMASLPSPTGDLHPFGKPDPAALEAVLGAPIIATLPLDPAVTAASDAGTPLGTGPVANALDAAAAALAESLKL